MFVLLSGTEVRFASGVVEEVDEGYLETGTNLVSVVSTLSFLLHHRCCLSALICNASNRPLNCRPLLGCCITRGKSTFKMCFLLLCSNCIKSHKLDSGQFKCLASSFGNTALWRGSFFWGAKLMEIINVWKISSPLLPNVIYSQVLEMLMKSNYSFLTACVGTIFGGSCASGDPEWVESLRQLGVAVRNRRKTTLVILVFFPVFLTFCTTGCFSLLCQSVSVSVIPLHSPWALCKGKVIYSLTFPVLKTALGLQVRLSYSLMGCHWRRCSSSSF